MPCCRTQPEAWRRGLVSGQCPAMMHAPPWCSVRPASPLACARRVLKGSFACLAGADTPCNQTLSAVGLRPQLLASRVTQLLGAGVNCRSVPQLQQLDLRFNPVQQHKAYRVMLDALTRLSRLDGLQQQPQHQQAGTTCLTAALLRDRATLWHSSSGESQARLQV